MTHLSRSVLSRSLACAELSLAVALPSIVVVAVVATRTRAHHARTGHCVVKWIVWGRWTRGLHLALVSCVIGRVDLREELFPENYCPNQMRTLLISAEIGAASDYLEVCESTLI